ncbi:hypothetical protein LEMLEM_LOCUS4708 [Lemmus lemmus]
MKSNRDMIFGIKCSKSDEEDRDGHNYSSSASLSPRHSGKGHRKWIWLYRMPGHQDCL